MKPILVTLFILVSNAVLFTSCTPIEETFEPDNIVVYKTIDTTSLSLHVFNPEGHKVTDNAPAIVFFFGGGWNQGTPRQFYEQARYFAQKGFVAMSAEYRVNKVHGTSPFDAVTDAKSSIRWIRQHAQELGINPNKIVASGASAGGHLAACTSFIEGFDATDEDLSISSEPSALVLYNPVYDTTEKGYGIDKVGADQKTTISPVHHINPGMVPTIVFHGTADTNVPYENAERFTMLMKKAGNDCILESYEDQGHGFFNGSFFRGKNADEVIYADIIEKSYAFLESRVLNPKGVDIPNKSYADDVAFMEEYIDLIQLSDTSNNSKVAISAALQARVMTSSASGEAGRSYGWINRELFASRDTLEHVNVFGGEERFWLGPEGGQYSIFFKKGTEFTLDDWYTPKLIDLEPFEVESVSSDKAVFTKKASLTNYSGFQFDMGIQREVAVLSKADIQKELGLTSLAAEVKTVAYQTTNTLTNIGQSNWQKETGLLSIWLLGMFNHSPHTTIVIPYVQGNDSDLGKVVNDTYFGKVPSDRLVVKEQVIYFSGDGEFRSKIGLSPMRAKDIAGSYDAANGILTIVKYNQPADATDYVNSMWEIQEKPFAGDVINAYNDGAPELGAKPLSPFYELETSSPALALKSGESGTHIQLTCHIEGDEAALNPIVKQLFGVTIDEIQAAFH